MTKKIALLIALIIISLTVASLFWLSNKKIHPTQTKETKPYIVTTIQPLHLIVKEITGSLYPIKTLLKHGQSPHDFQLSPSDIPLIQNASYIFQIGPQLERFMEKIQQVRPKQNNTMHMMSIPTLRILSQKENHAHDDEHETAHDDEHETDHDDEHAYDPHIWLDPNNAKIMMTAVADALSKTFPEHQATFSKNLKNALKKLHNTHLEIQKNLQTVQQKAFVTFHDAYQYFYTSYHLNHQGSLTLSGHTNINRLATIIEAVQQKNVRCILSEPQFNSQKVQEIAETLNIQSTQIDPLGQQQTHYTGLLQHIAQQLQKCLAS